MQSDEKSVCAIYIPDLISASLGSDIDRRYRDDECGIINDHSPQCFVFRELLAAENVNYIK